MEIDGTTVFQDLGRQKGQIGQFQEFHQMALIGQTQEDQHVQDHIQDHIHLIINTELFW